MRESRLRGDPGPGTAALFGSLDEDRTPQRATVYWVVLLILLGGTLLLRDSPWQSSPQLHTTLETVSTVIAAVIGGLALVRFYSKKRSTFLFIGTGFLGTALLDGYHAVMTSGLVDHGNTMALEDISAWSWIGSRFYLAHFLFVSWFAWHREEVQGDTEEVGEGSVYLTAALLIGLIFGFLTLFPPQQGYFPDLPLHRPVELLPALFFALSLGGYLWKGRWRTDPFEHWLIIALILSVAAHAAYLPFSRSLFDAGFDVGHLLKVVSYVAVLTGLLWSVFTTFRREERAMVEIQVANDALAREVAVRRRAERVLQESEERLQDFLDNANDLIQSTDQEGVLIYVNQAWLRTLGYEEERILGRRFEEFLRPSSKKRWRRSLERVLHGEAVTGIELDVVDANGHVMVCSGSANARFENGSAEAVRCIFRDVTEQRRFEREMAASRANLEALVESTGDAIWSVDRDHRLITFNSAFALAMEARTGREPHRGDPPDRIFGPDETQWYRTQYDRVLSGERFSLLRSEKIDGELRYYELFFNPIVEENGINGAVAFGRDVTRRVQAEEATRLAKEEAEAANRAKTQFLANMSHELRTPLNSVIGFTNILLKNREGSLDPKELNFLERVLANGRHLLSLINEVLDLAKIEAGRMELDLESVDLDELVRETLAQLEGQVKAKGKSVRLRPEVPPGLEPVETDRAKLKQVVINLVGNALKFTEEGEVAVIVEAEGTRPRKIHVRDTGIGIPPDRLEAIFEAFQQADSSTSRKYGGTGLGLTISRSICKMMGYDLGVESEVGKGSTFSIQLAEEAPARPEDEGSGGGESAEAAPDEGARGRGIRKSREDGRSRIPEFKVLVIDDEADSRIVMKHYLRDFGCEVVTASSASEGIELARKTDPDLITLDLMMPEMDGWETLRALKDDPELRGIPVVVVSIVASENRASLLGAVDLVSKPVEREDLLRVLWRNLLHRSAERVMVVEDDPDARELFRTYLEGVGMDVVAAGNGSEALRMIGQESPDAIVLDLMMPVMDGMTFLQRLREIPEFIGIPVIVVTSKELTAEDREELQEKASAVIQKGEQVEDRLKDFFESIFARGGAEREEISSVGRGDVSDDGTLGN